jgi:hypothetical protein
MKSKNIAAGAALLAGFLVASNAGAYTYTTCGDVKVVWSSSFAMVQNTFSIAPGSSRESALDNAIGRWRGVDGMMNMVSKSSTVNAGSSVTFFNFQNDVAVVPSANIGNNNGLTLMLSDGCFFGGDMEWIEADVMVASNLAPYGPLDETSLATSGRKTFIHEFGHAHGLGHSQRFNNMRSVQPRPQVGGTGETVDVLPDDAQGGRFLYPSGNSEVNLFAAAHRRTSGDQIVLNDSGTLTFCSKGGADITLNATVGNNGTVDVKQTERWWVSTSGNAYSGGTQIGSWANGTFLANKVKTRQVTFTMPALTPGTYFLYHGVDVLKEVDESREDDNNVREAVKVQVNKC